MGSYVSVIVYVYMSFVCFFVFMSNLVLFVFLNIVLRYFYKVGVKGF